VDGQLQILRWGARRGQSRGLPLTAWARTDTLQAGGWGGLEPERVVIPATMGLDRGVWFRVREGACGLLVRDEQERPVVYVLVEPASHYYKVMTRSDWMPVLVGETI
jgi:hypothetical protein